MLLLREEFTRYAAQLGTFMEGAGAVHTPGAVVDVRFEIDSQRDLWR